MFQLRGYVVLDNMQTQVSAIISNTSRGFLPVKGVTSLFVEVQPAIFVHRILDVALKATAVYPAMAIVEREYGILEVHHEDQGEVRQAGSAILDFLKTEEEMRLKPRVLTSQIIRGIEAYHAQVINKSGNGQKILTGDSLFILETIPSIYVAYAANQAEKAAKVDIVEIRYFGAFGRLYLSGQESEIDSAAEAAIRALTNLDGRESG